MVYDSIIIGAGPAGITASVYAARKQMKFLVISMDVGGQTLWTGDIENYTGYQFITGADLTAKFEEHIKDYGVEIKKEQVQEISRKDDLISIKTDKAQYQSKTAIIASGKKSRELGVEGENEFRNKGVTYCATCDGPLFKDKNVAVIGGGNSALDAAIQMMNIAGKVYLINIAPEFTGDPIMQKQVQSSDNVEILNNSRVATILGDKFVEKIRVKTGDEEKTISVKGIFVEIGLIPNTQFAKTIDKNDKNEIKVNCLNETNIEGVFAAGDVTDVQEKQIIIAAGEGAKAALSAYRYLIKKPAYREKY